MSIQSIKAELPSLYCLNLGGLIALTVLAYFYRNPYAAFFIPILFGFSILLFLMNNKEGVSIDILIALSPAVGFSILVLMMYTGSALNIGLTNTVVMYNIIALAFSAYTCFKPPNRYTINIQSVRDISMMILPVIFIVLVHRAVYTYPTDNVDNLFHATKIEYLLKYNSMYPKTVPVFNILTYPGGYHSIVAYIISITKTNIPEAMKTFRILAWILFSLGVYMFSRTWFSKKIARFSILAIISTNICYYYLIIYIEPNFTGFYFFLVALSLSYSYLNNDDIKRNLHYFYAISIIIVTTTIFVHPYSFQNFIAMISMYILLTYLKLLVKKSHITFPKNILSFTIIYAILPLAIYTALNPFFIMVDMKHLILQRWITPHDTVTFLRLLVSWSTIRNGNYAELIFMVLSGMYIIFRDRSKKAEYITLLAFFMFVFALIMNRLTINVRIPFYGTAALERMYLWLVPLFPVIIGMGFYYSHEIARDSKKVSIKAAYILLIAGFFIVPTWGTAVDLISAESNFYVTPKVMEDFIWIEKHVPSSYVLNSCYSDPTPWLPFFAGPKNSYTVMFNKRINNCRFNNLTFNETITYLINTTPSLSDTIAFIDTNAPSLNPLEFLDKYKILRINGDDWIFNLSSRDISENMKIARESLKLCSPTLPGNTFEFGKYYIWGVTKRYFYITYFGIEKNEYYAWVMGNQAIVAFNPCREYKGIILTFFVNEPMFINITVNGAPIIVNYKITEGYHTMKINATLEPNQINTIKLSKTKGVLLIKNIKMGDGQDDP
ncbi:DUF6541 family protein [Thermococcus sp.]